MYLLHFVTGQAGQVHVRVAQSGIYDVVPAFDKERIDLTAMVSQRCVPKPL